MNFVKFWIDVFRDSLWVTFTGICVVVDLLALRPFLTKRPDKLPAWSVKWVATKLAYSVRLWVLAAAFAASLMWTTYGKWAVEVARADKAEQALELRTRQQFPRFPIGHSSLIVVHRFESLDWVALETSAVSFDWLTVPPDADVFATVRVRMYGRDRNPAVAPHA